MKVMVISPNPNVYVFELHIDCVISYRMYLPEMGLREKKLNIQNQFKIVLNS